MSAPPASIDLLHSAVGELDNEPLAGEVFRVIVSAQGGRVDLFDGKAHGTRTTSQPGYCPPVALKSVNEVLAALDAEDDAALIGLEESRWFDAKGGPYRLGDSHTRKWELAKDVSAMANSDGGLILVGAKTQREQSWLEERVSELSPVPEDLLDVQRHLDVIRTWTVPPIAHRVHPTLFRRESGTGLLAIAIDPAPDDERPIMVRTLAEGGRDVQAFAIARRYGTATEWVSGAQVWADMRDGRLSRTREQRALVTTPSMVDRIGDAIERLESLTEASERAVLVYAAHPVASGGNLPDFFAREGTLGALQSLPERSLRSNGFGLAYGIDVDTVDGSLAAIEPQRRGIMVSRDGLVVAMALATDDFLGWGSQRNVIPPASLRDTPALALNHVVLAEYTLEFTRFVRDAIVANLIVTDWSLHVFGRRLKTGEPCPYLPRSMNWLSHAAEVARVDEANEQFVGSGDAEIDAFGLLGEFIQWFGIPRTEVPYAENARITEQTVRGIGASG